MCIYVYIYIHTYTNIYLYTCTYTYIYIYIWIHTYVNMYYVCICMCKYIHTEKWKAYTYKTHWCNAISLRMLEMTVFMWSEPFSLPVLPMLQYVTMRCSVMQCVTVRCSVLQYVAVCGSTLHCVAVCRIQYMSIYVCIHECSCETSPVHYLCCPWCRCYSVIQYVAVRCGALQRVAVCFGVFRYITVRCSALQSTIYTILLLVLPILQCVAVCCSVLQCVAVCCSVLQSTTYTIFLLVLPILQCVTLCCSVLQCLVVSIHVCIHVFSTANSRWTKQPINVNKSNNRFVPLDLLIIAEWHNLVAKTHEMLYLYRILSAIHHCNQWLFFEKRPAT